VRRSRTTDRPSDTAALERHQPRRPMRPRLPVRPSDAARRRRRRDRHPRPLATNSGVASTRAAASGPERRCRSRREAAAPSHRRDLLCDCHGHLGAGADSPPMRGLQGTRRRRRTASNRPPRSWRNPGRPRPSYAFGVFPRRPQSGSADRSRAARLRVPAGGEKQGPQADQARLPTHDDAARLAGGEWEERGDARTETPFHFSHGCHELGAVAGCFRLQVRPDRLPASPTALPGKSIAATSLVLARPADYGERSRRGSGSGPRTGEPVGPGHHACHAQRAT
jgi:hypothetical protein